MYLTCYSEQLNNLMTLASFDTSESFVSLSHSCKLFTVLLVILGMEQVAFVIHPWYHLCNPVRLQSKQHVLGNSLQY